MGQTEPEILAAGGVVWRRGDDGRPEIAVVYRPKYDDWTLPKGKLDPGETFEQAALREAHEEVALPLDGVRVVGALTPLDIPVSGFRLHPIVAVAAARPPLAAVDGEVARILDVSVDELLDPEALVRLERERDGVALNVPAFAIAGQEIWGATAMVLAEFLTLLGWTPPKSLSRHFRARSARSDDAA